MDNNEIKHGIYREDDGAISYYLNGKLHRENGPARIFSNGFKAWYLNDQLHREDGPAVERFDGTKAWWLRGILYSEQEFNFLMGKQQLTEELNINLELREYKGKKKI